MQDNINQLNKGLDKDTSPIKQSDETVNFVLNGIYNEFDGEYGSIQNEPGNELCWSLPDGYRILGHVNMGNDEVLILSLNKAISKSAIGVASKGCNYEHLVVTGCLGFDSCYMIKGKYRNIKGCGRTVYLYDALNYDLSINIDQLEKYTQTYEEIDEVSGRTLIKHYTVEEANTLNKWDCNEMRLEPEFLIPCIKDAEVSNSGGQLDLGLWKFAVELLDSDQNSIGFSPISQAITIYDEDVVYNIRNSWPQMDGGYNLSLAHTAEAGGVPISNKSIRLTIGHIDTRFKYIRVYGIVARTGNGVTVEVIKKGDLIPIATEEIEYIFTGFNIANGDFLTTIETITAIRDRYVSSKAMEFVDKRLVRYNLTKEITDWSYFQRAVSLIETEFVWKEITPQNTKLGDPKNPLTTFKLMSEMGDEITAWGLVYEFKQGFYSPPFHIPGRCINEYDQQEVFGGTETVTINYTLTDIQKYVNNNGDIEIRISYTFDPALQNPSFAFDLHGQPNSTPFGSFGESEGYMTFIYPNGTIDYNLGRLEITSNAGASGEGFTSIPINFASAYDTSGSFQIAQLIPSVRWEDQNTAQITGTRSGIMGYHQCKDSYYPNILDCNGESIWGVDSCGNELINTPIRHHRLPDRSLVPHYDYASNTIRPLGVRFSNISYPHPDIIGHHFVRVDRDEFTKTVLGAGFLHGMCVTDDTVVNTKIWQPSTVHHEFLSPDVKIAAHTLNGDYIKVNHKVSTINAHQTVKNYDEASVKLGGDDLQIGLRIIRGDSLVPINSYKLDIEDNRLISALSKSAGTNEIVNALWDNKVNYIRTDEVSDRKVNELLYSYIKRDIDPYCNLDSLIYYRTHSCAFHGYGGTFEIYGGDTFINYINPIRSWLSDIDPSQSASILTIVGIILTGALAIVTAGTSLLLTALLVASGVTAVGVAAIIAAGKEGRYNDCTTDSIRGEDFPFFGDGFVLFVSELVDELYAESEVNYDLRHTGSSELTKNLEDFRTGNDYLENITQYLENKYLTYNEEEERNEIRDMILPEIYWYNPDFHLLKAIGENRYIPLAQTYDYCEDCGDREPNAVIWSERAFDEETADAMKIFLPLNKITIGNHAGEITNAKFDRNRMLVTTTNSAFFISPNPRVLQADEDDIHTGLGDFLSIPEQEYIKVEWGFGGNQGRFNAIQSEFGWSYADQQNGRIFNYTSGGLDHLTKGLTQWFEQELPSKLLTLLEEQGIEHSCPDSVTDFNGLGLQGVYDPRYKRYILHKTDFLPKKFNGRYKLTGQPNREGFYYMPERNVWIDIVTGGLENFIPLGHPDYFTNESWTISYSFLHQAWISYHSYQPSYMFNNGDTFFTFNFDEQSWKHVDRNFTTYYGDKYDFIVDYTVNNLPTDDLQAIHWYSRSKAWDTLNKRWIDVADKTFDKMLIYNSNQATGTQNLIYLDKETNPFGNRIGWSNTDKDVILTEKDYKVSAIRDLTIAQPGITSDFEHLADQFNLSDSNRQGYIDLVSFDDNIDYTKSEYNLADMKDKYHLIRLYFTKSNTDDIKIILDIINSRTFPSIH